MTAANFRYLSVPKIVEMAKQPMRFFQSGQQFLHFEHDHQCIGGWWKREKREREREYVIIVFTKDE